MSKRASRLLRKVPRVHPTCKPNPVIASAPSPSLRAQRGNPWIATAYGLAMTIAPSLRLPRHCERSVPVIASAAWQSRAMAKEWIATAYGLAMTIAPSLRLHHPRHCERSAAIQGPWIATAYGLAMTIAGQNGSLACYHPFIT